MLGRKYLERRTLDGKLGCSRVVGGSHLARAKGILLGGFLGEVALEIPPHEPQEGCGSALAAQVRAHDEVEEIARREEVQLRDLGRVLRQDKDEVDGIGARDGSCHDLLDGAGLLLVLSRALEDGL